MLGSVRSEVDEVSALKCDALLSSLEDREKLSEEKQQDVDALLNMALAVHTRLRL